MVKVEFMFARNLTFLFVVSIAAQLQGQKSDFKPITFDSANDLKVTADLYMAHDNTAPFIVLCHQAGWSRGEYREIAPKLNKLGFNCMAIDQRSGGGVNDIKNESMKAAKAKKLGTEFTDAEADMIRALEHARSSYAQGQVILWGSSYSAALSLRIAGENPELVDGVMAFAPGEYFERLGQPKDWISQSAKKIAAPAFITSAKNEEKNWKAIFESIPGQSKTAFLPKTKGNHGSRALWEKFDDHKSYWAQVNTFLAPFTKTTQLTNIVGEMKQMETDPTTQLADHQKRQGSKTTAEYTTGQTKLEMLSKEIKACQKDLDTIKKEHDAGASSVDWMQKLKTLETDLGKTKIQLKGGSK